MNWINFFQVPAIVSLLDLQELSNKMTKKLHTFLHFNALSHFLPSFLGNWNYLVLNVTMYNFHLFLSLPLPSCLQPRMQAWMHSQPLLADRRQWVRILAMSWMNRTVQSHLRIHIVGTHMCRHSLISTGTNLGITSSTELFLSYLKWALSSVYFCNRLCLKTMMFGVIFVSIIWNWLFFLFFGKAMHV